MQSILVVAAIIGAIVMFKFLFDRAKGFNEPSTMPDKEILSAIAGQADWLEKQAHHSMKFGGSEPYPELASKRREYVYQLCSTLISRHPDPINVMYNATKRAKQLESEGQPRQQAVVNAVKEKLFAENGYTYMARWHN